MNHYLFLDIDGVLNNVFQVQSSIKRKKVSWVGSIPKITCQAELDLSSLTYVNYYIERYDPEIVIASAWRKYVPEGELPSLLDRNGLSSTQNIVGVTPEVDIFNRGKEISLWLENNHDTKRDYILMIFDDGHETSILKHFEEDQFLHVKNGWLSSGFQFSHLWEAVRKTEKQFLLKEFPYERIYE